MSSRRALVIGCNRYQYCRPLKNAEYDAERFFKFLVAQDGRSVPHEDVVLLRSPQLSDVKAALEVACETVTSDGILIVYVSGHGLLSKQGSVLLAFSDTEPQKVLTALPLTSVIELLAENSISGSILILDLCYSGAHAKAASELALRRLYQREEQASIGHFILASSGPSEESVENLGGGTFTQILLNQIDRIGGERPFDEHISMATLAAAVVTASAGVLSQKPMWTGISISSHVWLSRNPHFDSEAPRPATAASLRELPDSDRKMSAPYARAFALAMGHVGSGATWMESASRSILLAAATGIADDSASTLVARLIESAHERVEVYGDEQDRVQFLGVLEAAVVALALRGALDTADGSSVIFRVAEHATRLAAELQLWLRDRASLLLEDGPAAIALAPIRFWNVVGSASLIAAAKGAMGRPEEHGELLGAVLDVLRANRRLWRIEWAGQYPDIMSALGLVASKDLGLCNEIVQQLIRAYVAEAVAGNLPIPASADAQVLGTELANKYSLTRRDTETLRPADEAPAALMFVLSRVCGSDLEVNSIIGHLASQETMGNYYLYVPRTFRAQFTSRMDDCDVRSWVRRAELSAAQMLRDFDSIQTSIASPEGIDIWRASVASIAAGRLYRNRSCFWVFDALARKSVV
ncbi:MAG: caspase family protein [Polyangiaceae bacterium]|nr:caspase family protein [Polyangiaceae bacterium]